MATPMAVLARDAAGLGFGARNAAEAFGQPSISQLAWSKVSRLAAHRGGTNTPPRTLSVLSSGFNPWGILHDTILA